MNRTVLVIDDDQPLRESLCDALADEGFTAIGAANGQEGLEYLRASPDRPCVIFVDLMMPVMNGWQFLEARKESPELRDIPVIVLTANGKVDRERIPAADDLIFKPLKLETLLSTAQRFCPC